MRRPDIFEYGRRPNCCKAKKTEGGMTMHIDCNCRHIPIRIVSFMQWKFISRQHRNGSNGIYHFRVVICKNEDVRFLLARMKPRLCSHIFGRNEKFTNQEVVITSVYPLLLHTAYTCHCRSAPSCLVLAFFAFLNQFLLFSLPLTLTSSSCQLSWLQQLALVQWVC